jgi:hypothetical protein
MPRAKKNRTPVTSASKLVTTQAARRSGFLEYALRRNEEALPFIDCSRALKAYLEKHSTSCDDIEKLSDIRDPLLQAAGISEKARAHLSSKDQTELLREFVSRTLVPIGEQYVEEIVYRYLLSAGDALGGKMRNIVGAIAGEKFTRAVIAALTIRSVKFTFVDRDEALHAAKAYSVDKAANIKAIEWSVDDSSRYLIYNIKVPQVRKNIDIVLLNRTLYGAAKADRNRILADRSSYVAMGELKGGIDPAGADEHWKTANTALERVRQSFPRNVPLFFAGAAIELAMAKEIFEQIKNGDLAHCANITVDDQLDSLCEWLVRR